MKKVMLLFAMLCLIEPSVAFENRETAAQVYICTGPKAKAYHKTDRCRGLNRCSGKVVSVSLEKAKQMGRRPCGICY